MKKIISFILAAALGCLLLASCSEDTVSYKTDVAVSALSEAADAKIPDAGNMSEVPAAYIEGMHKITVSDSDEYIVKIQSGGTAFNEYGIFKAKDTDGAEALRTALENYLDDLRENFMGSYQPEEVPKLENATVKVMGQYVVYGILDDSVKSDVFTAIENLLLGK